MYTGEKARGGTAREEAAASKRQATAAEQAARQANFRILHLERQLSIMGDAVPRGQHMAAVQQLESQNEKQAQHIAALQEQINQLEAHLAWGGEAEGGASNPTADRLRLDVGVERGRHAPSREFRGNTEAPTAMRNWVTRSMAHITAVLRSRPMGHILSAVKRLGRMRELADCADFATECRRIVQNVANTITRRWSARLSVHVWDRLELSRARMDDLRHLLSFIYQPLCDSYQPIMLWVNAHDPTDSIAMPALVGRAGRERLFWSLAGEGEITVGENGRCERDANSCASQLYSRFARAMRSDFSSARPARPILFFDGTGGSLGKGICHAELGSADFSGDCKQSRQTLNPLAMYTGNDHALPLRANLEFSMGSFNQLSKDGQIERDDGVRLPCEPIVVGDMQGVKCIMGMSETCHSVWCKCKARGGVEGEGPQHQYGEPGSQFNRYQEMLDFYERIGCEFKTEDFLLACAHLSKGLFYGGKFTPFECPDCGYKPTAARARADLARFNALSDEEQREERREHVRGGAHWHVELFMGPMPKGFGMRRCGADQLHLIYLNMFKHLFKYTIHEPLPESKRKTVSEYLSAAGFYSYDAADDSDDPVKRWIGREVKRLKGWRGKTASGR